MLFKNVGEDGRNFTQTIFMDSAPEPIAAGVAALTDMYSVMQFVNTLLNEDINGTWQLEVHDSYPIDGGMLNNWEVAFSGTPTPTWNALDYDDYQISSLYNGVLSRDKATLKSRDLGAFHVRPNNQFAFCVNSEVDEATEPSIGDG